MDETCNLESRNLRNSGEVKDANRPPLFNLPPKPRSFIQPTASTNSVLNGVLIESFFLEQSFVLDNVRSSLNLLVHFTFIRFLWIRVLI